MFYKTILKIADWAISTGITQYYRFSVQANYNRQLTKIIHIQKGLGCTQVSHVCFIVIFAEGITMQNMKKVTAILVLKCLNVL